MEVEATELFLKNYRRTNNRSQIRNTLLTLRQRMDSSPNWLHNYEHVTNCALKTTFRAKLSKGDRLLLNHKPPLLGVIISSTVGWSEIATSGVGLEYPDKEKPMIHEYQTTQTQKKYPESPGYSKAKPRTTSSEDSEGRVCTECVRYTTKVECEHCGAREA